VVSKNSATPYRTALSEASVETASDITAPDLPRRVGDNELEAEVEPLMSDSEAEGPLDAVGECGPRTPLTSESLQGLGHAPAPYVGIPVGSEEFIADVSVMSALDARTLGDCRSFHGHAIVVCHAAVPSGLDAFIRPLRATQRAVSPHPTGPTVLLPTVDLPDGHVTKHPIIPIVLMAETCDMDVFEDLAKWCALVLLPDL
jgi:hypothetical protein